jgi:hypothetical protein
VERKDIQHTIFSIIILIMCIIFLVRKIIFLIYKKKYFDLEILTFQIFKIVDVSLFFTKISAPGGLQLDLAQQDATLGTVSF